MSHYFESCQKVWTRPTCLSCAWHCVRLSSFDNRGGREFDVEAGEQSMGSQLTVLSETEAASLVAKRPDAESTSSPIISPSSSLFHANPPSLLLQQPPFTLRGASRGYNSQHSHDLRVQRRLLNAKIIRFLGQPYHNMHIIAP